MLRFGAAVLYKPRAKPRAASRRSSRLRRRMQLREFRNSLRRESGGVVDVGAVAEKPELGAASKQVRHPLSVQRVGAKKGRHAC